MLFLALILYERFLSILIILDHSLGIAENLAGLIENIIRINLTHTIVN